MERGPLSLEAERDEGLEALQAYLEPGDEWFAIPTSWYAHWLLFVGLPEDQWGQHGVPELVAASDGPSFEELAQRDEPPGRLATLPLLDDWGLGLRPDLAEDRDFSFVPRAFWEKVCLRPQYGLQPGHVAILRRAFLRPGAVEPQLEAHPRVAHVWLCNPEAPTDSGELFSQATCALRLLLPATLQVDEVRHKLVYSLAEAWHAAKSHFEECKQAASSSSAGPKQQRALDEAREKWANLSVLDPKGESDDARLWFRPPPSPSAEAGDASSSSSSSSTATSPTAGGLGTSRHSNNLSSGNLHALASSAASSSEGETLPVGGCGDGWEVVLGVANLLVEELAPSLASVHFLVEQPLRSSSHGGDLYPRDRAWRLHLRPNDPLDARDREGKWFESVVVARGAVSELAPPLVKRTGMGIPQRTTLEQQVAQQPSADAVVVHFKAWTDRFDECKLLKEHALDLRPRFSVTPNWRAALAVNDLVEVKMPTALVNNNSSSSSRKASSSSSSSGGGALWYTAQVARVEAEKGLVHVRAFVGGLSTRNYTVDVDADHMCWIGTHQNEAAAKHTAREINQALAAASPAGGSYRRRSMSGAFDDSPGGPVGNSPGGPGAAGFASPARRPSSMRPRADSGSNGNGASSSSSSSGVGFGSLAKRNAEGSPDAPGVVGLTNLGNTCYMNSVLQCLLHLHELRDFFLDDVATVSSRGGGDDDDDDGNAPFMRELNEDNILGSGGRVALAFGSFQRDVWSGRYRTVVPVELKRSIADFACQFQGYDQHDASELLMVLLDALHEDLNRVVTKKPYFERLGWAQSHTASDELLAREALRRELARNRSRIYDFCLGQLASRLTCALCGAQTRAFDPFTMVSLPVPAAAAAASTPAASTTAAPGSYAGTVAASSSASSSSSAAAAGGGASAVVRGLFFPLPKKTKKKSPGNQTGDGKDWVMEDSGAVAFAAPLGANPTAGQLRKWLAVRHRLLPGWLPLPLPTAATTKGTAPAAAAKAAGVAGTGGVSSPLSPDSSTSNNSTTSSSTVHSPIEGPSSSSSSSSTVHHARAGGSTASSFVGQEGDHGAWADLSGVDVAALAAGRLAVCVVDPSTGRVIADLHAPPPPNKTSSTSGGSGVPAASAVGKSARKPLVSSFYGSSSSSSASARASSASASTPPKDHMSGGCGDLMLPAWCLSPSVAVDGSKDSSNHSSSSSGSGGVLCVFELAHSCDPPMPKAVLSGKDFGFSSSNSVRGSGNSGNATVNARGGSSVSPSSGGHDPQKKSSGGGGFLRYFGFWGHSGKKHAEKPPKQPPRSSKELAAIAAANAFGPTSPPSPLQIQDGGNENDDDHDDDGHGAGGSGDSGGGGNGGATSPLAVPGGSGNNSNNNNNSSSHQDALNLLVSSSAPPPEQYLAQLQALRVCAVDVLETSDDVTAASSPSSTSWPASSSGGEKGRGEGDSGGGGGGLGSQVRVPRRLSVCLDDPTEGGVAKAAAATAAVMAGDGKDNTDKSALANADMAILAAQGFLTVGQLRRAVEMWVVQPALNRAAAAAAEASAAGSSSVPRLPDYSVFVAVSPNALAAEGKDNDAEDDAKTTATQKGGEGDAKADAKNEAKLNEAKEMEAKTTARSDGKDNDEKDEMKTTAGSFSSPARSIENARAAAAATSVVVGPLGSLSSSTTTCSALQWQNLAELRDAHPLLQLLPYHHSAVATTAGAAAGAAVAAAGGGGTSTVAPSTPPRTLPVVAEGTRAFPSSGGSNGLAGGATTGTAPVVTVEVRWGSSAGASTSASTLLPPPPVGRPSNMAEARNMQAAAQPLGVGSSGTDLASCLRLFEEPEQLDESECITCDRCCRPSRAFKTMELWSTPDVLCVHLKRFSMSASSGLGGFGGQSARFARRRKVTTLVEYPPHLDLNGFVAGPQANAAGTNYALCGVVKHTGDLNGGHYTSLACDTDDPSRWYHFNDSIATPLPPTASVVTKDAYILFYRRTDGSSSNSGESSSSQGTKLLAVGPAPHVGGAGGRERGGGRALAAPEGEQGDPVNVPRAAPQLYGGVAPTAEGEWEDSPVLL